MFIRVYVFIFYFVCLFACNYDNIFLLTVELLEIELLLFIFNGIYKLPCFVFDSKYFVFFSPFTYANFMTSGMLSFHGNK
jgi:hypothetical protein